MIDAVGEEVFENVRVLSLADQLPGPFATMLLTDLGADVVLVERSSGGDPTLAFPSLFTAMARNQRSMCIDLKSGSGRAQFLALVRTADVVMEGFRRAGMDRLGLVYPIWRKGTPALCTRPSLASARPTPTLTGPRLRPVMPGAGGSSLRRHARRALRRPVRCHVRSLLDGRSVPLRAHRTWDEHQCFHGGRVGVVYDAVPGPALNGQAPSDLGAEPVHGLFACGDGWALCDVLGLADVAGLRARVPRAAELRERVAAFLAEGGFAAWGARLDAAGLPCSPVQKLRDVAADPHFGARGLFDPCQVATARVACSSPCGPAATPPVCAGACRAWGSTRKSC